MCFADHESKKKNISCGKNSENWNRQKIYVIQGRLPVTSYCWTDLFPTHCLFVALCVTSLVVMVTIMNVEKSEKCLCLPTNCTKHWFNGIFPRKLMSFNKKKSFVSFLRLEFFPLTRFWLYLIPWCISDFL